MKDREPLCHLGMCCQVVNGADALCTLGWATQSLFYTAFCGANRFCHQFLSGFCTLKQT